MFKAEKALFIIGAFLLVALTIGAIILFSIPTPKHITSFDECVTAGYPVLESYPEQCKTKDGQTFTKDLPSPTTLTPKPIPSSTRSPTPSPKSKAQIKSKTYSDQYLSFTYPGNWNPTIQDLEPGATKEIIHLGIPELESDQTVSFFFLSLDQIKPADIIEELDITISGQPGKKWIRHGEGYFSYDYYTKDPNSEGSFGLHVTTSERDSSIEKELDQLVQTMKLK